MAQLWGGRFTKETDKLVYNFNASISFDQKFYEQDIRGSKAHVKMLAKQGILTEEERDKILEGLEGILADVRQADLQSHLNTRIFIALWRPISLTESEIRVRSFTPEEAVMIRWHWI